MKYCLCGEKATIANTKGEAFCVACYEEEKKFTIRMSNKSQAKQSKLRKFKPNHCK